MHFSLESEPFLKPREGGIHILRKGYGTAKRNLYQRKLSFVRSHDNVGPFLQTKVPLEKDQ
ncbi:hypothetical protein CH370_07800 [Leptospira kmetyi]|uniref:Uncharacterized protein n=1 Tax=Leptospira kmetyi TaxID=408139 RepID=A0A2M9XS60_9LEPT|nr:hypothetical protein EFP84_13250 [Leptospira kmetyi]PJZ28581.1 hypothetical protein CH378_17100 [Leptospira kmetyi]PJZ42140.1 hypothetical protein CH370_07800 [Leptospira kmetyi]TGK10771.1 hypothetical protein EHO62_20110 [Leptospira kmetyi]TGK24977.1 hypothetical protein EHO66_19160 [Leptospira kmetyi]